MSNYRVHNIDRALNAGFGDMPCDHDRACVVDTSRWEPNILSEVLQPVIVHLGTIATCRDFLAGTIGAQSNPEHADASATYGDRT